MNGGHATDVTVHVDVDVEWDAGPLDAGGPGLDVSFGMSEPAAPVRFGFAFDTRFEAVDRGDRHPERSSEVPPEPPPTCSGHRVEEVI